MGKTWGGVGKMRRVVGKTWISVGKKKCNITFPYRNPPPPYAHTPRIVRFDRSSRLCDLWDPIHTICLWARHETPPVACRLRRTALAAALDKHLGPACRQPRTRADYWWAWRLVVTWAVARKAVKDILSMKMDTLKALSWGQFSPDVGCFSPASRSAR